MSAASRPREPMLTCGLSSAEATARLSAFGPNQLPEPRSPTLARRLLRSLRDPLVLVLLTALALTLLTADFADSAVIGLVVVVNTVIGLHQEIQADRSVRALSRLVATKAWVQRSGRILEAPVADLVPGDVILLRQGDLVPADGVLIEGSGVEVDESTVTGEAYPVAKIAADDPGPDPAPEADSLSQADPATGLSSGTVVLHGHGVARVTATGARSTVGRIASLLAPAPTATPLQRRMARLSAQLAAVAVLLSVMVMLLGLSRGQDLELMVLTTIALVVAAVPESLPLVVTVCLALAARRMASRHAVVKSLSAVETLGSVTLLATDKTGTLTQGSMSVTEIWNPASVRREDLLRAVALCNDATADDGSGPGRGDPTESALLAAAAAHGTDVDDLKAAYPRIDEVPFNSTRKAMTTIHAGTDACRLIIHKGAPESMLAPSFLTDPAVTIEQAQEQAESWARRGLRVIAVAEQVLGAEEPTDGGEGVHLLGLLGLQDPLRSSSTDTVARCRGAGLRVVLITGDHPATAQAIASLVGIGHGEPATSLTSTTPDVAASRHLDGGVIARATPADKHALVTAFQNAGQVVAMTGDGVNDAPALRQAEIGVAMGERGTEVARQAADLVLTDDNLGTLIAAVEEGRRVYDNIRRFLVYGLSGGASEVLLMLAGPALGVPLPLLPAQILWVNLLTHSFAGAGLAAQPVDEKALRRGPRPAGQGPLAAGLWWRTLVLAVYLAGASAAAMLLSPEGVSQSAALLALGAGQLAVAWGVRTAGAPVRRTEGGLDPLVPALLLAGTMLVASTTVPPLRELLDTQAVGAGVWGLACLAATGAFALARLLRVRSL